MIFNCIRSTGGRRSRPRGRGQLRDNNNDANLEDKKNIDKEGVGLLRKQADETIQKKIKRLEIDEEKDVEFIDIE